MPGYLICPRIPHKQIELWGITTTSGNFRSYQIQTANIHFNARNIFCPGVCVVTVSRVFDARLLQALVTATTVRTEDRVYLVLIYTPVIATQGLRGTGVRTS